MIRAMPVRPVVGQEAVSLPLTWLLALGEHATSWWQQPVFDLQATAEALLGSPGNVDKVLRPNVWAEKPEQDRLREHRVPDFLGIAGDLPRERQWRRFDVVHCLCDLGSASGRNPFLSLGQLVYPGKLRDALVDAGTRLLILQTVEQYASPHMLSERMAELIVGAGGPSVLVVAGKDLKGLNRYLVNVYSAILGNQSLDTLANVEIPDSRIVLVHGQGGTRALQFDGLIEQMGERLSDYFSLVSSLQSRIGSRSDVLARYADDVRTVEDLTPRIVGALRALENLKARRWGQSTRDVLALAEIAEALESMNRDIGWHTGEGPLHTKLDMLQYTLELTPRELGEATNSFLELDPRLRGKSSPAADSTGEPFTEITVFFGTNRSKAPKGAFYGTKRDSMHYGRCLVSVPSDRRIGTIPRPSIWTLYKASRKKHFVVQSMAEEARADFVKTLRKYIGACTSRDALLFVHGFNVDFVSAVYRTAQISADLNFPGASLLFSWPSKGSASPLAYTHDETQARWTLGDLREFLELIVEQSGATTIHLLAHSMGNRALSEAVSRVGATAARGGGTLFNEIVLTAPDIDTDTFVNDIAPAIVPTARRVTLYASSKDKALAFSKKVHTYDRAGESGQKIVLLDGVDTIDVSAVDTNFVGHFYYGENKSVLSDIFNLIQGQPVSKRFGLKQRTRNKRFYWVFQP
jgi:esterase/lipase superfamily enzyme